jgi:predicted Fe-Mo cluster-binding NifX family protein
MSRRVATVRPGELELSPMRDTLNRRGAAPQKGAGKARTPGEGEMSDIPRGRVGLRAAVVVATAALPEEAARPWPGAIAVSAEGPETGAQIASLAGIAPYFHLYGPQGDPLATVANPFLDRQFGIGPAAAEWLADQGVKVIVGGRVPGPRMMDALQGRDMRFVRRSGTVQDLVDELSD